MHHPRVSRMDAKKGPWEKPHRVPILTTRVMYSYTKKEQSAVLSIKLCEFSRKVRMQRKIIIERLVFEMIF